MRENDRLTEAIVPPFGGDPFPVEASGLLIGGSGDVISGRSISTGGLKLPSDMLMKNEKKQNRKIDNSEYILNVTTL